MMRILALILSVMLMLFLLSACGAAAGKSQPTDKAVSTAPAAIQLHTVTPGKLTVATYAFFPPFEYFDGDKIIGIDAEIAQAIADRLGLELIIHNMDLNSVVSAVSVGAADMGLAGMKADEEKYYEVKFSITYANGVQSVIVKEGAAITSVDDITAETKIGVQLGTAGDYLVSSSFGVYSVVPYSSGTLAIQALVDGEIDCVIIDEAPARTFAAASEGLLVLDTPYADEDYAACFDKENDALREAVNAVIAQLHEDGTIDAIMRKYIPSNSQNGAAGTA